MMSDPTSDELDRLLQAARKGDYAAVVECLETVDCRAAVNQYVRLLWCRCDAAAIVGTASLPCTLRLAVVMRRLFDCWWKGRPRLTSPTVAVSPHCESLCDNLDFIIGVVDTWH